MFLMNQWYAAALPRELSDKPLARTICGKPIVMFRTASGIPAAEEVYLKRPLRRGGA